MNTRALALAEGRSLRRRRNRGGVSSIALALALIPVIAVASADERRVEAENGEETWFLIYQCIEGFEFAGVVYGAHYSGGAAMFLPQFGCSFHIHVPSPALLRIRYQVTGDAEVCGSFAVTGLAVGETGYRCDPGDAWIDAEVHLDASATPGRVLFTWMPDPGYANAYVDYLVVE